MNSYKLLYNESGSCLTPNHLLFGRTLLLPNPSTIDLSFLNPNPIIKPTKLQNIINHFWDRWRKEYLVNLREHQKISSYKKKQANNTTK